MALFLWLIGWSGLVLVGRFSRLGWSVHMKSVYLLYLSVMHVENSAAESIISSYLTFASSVNSNIQLSDGFIKCEGTCWWAMYWGNLMILTPVKHSRVTKFSLTTSRNDTGFCSVGLQTVCSYMHERRCKLSGLLYLFFSFLVWYCLKHISACKFGFFKCVTETISYSASFRFAVATHNDISYIYL